LGAMVDVILQLVDRASFGKIMEMTVKELATAMDEQSLRGSRPESDSRFHRDFEVDIEGDVLEWIDGSAAELDMESTPLSQTAPSSELVLLLAKWCSTAEWRCWDARLFLYVEPFLGRNVASADEFLLPSTWSEFSDSMSRTDRASYSESVVLDWMARRESLGETMEPSEDPRILPTMESHKSLSLSLFSLVEKLRGPGYELLLGMEYLDPTEWHLGGTRISEASEGRND